MTIGGALSDLNNLLKADDIPFYYKPSIKAVMDTIALSGGDLSSITPQEPILEKDGTLIVTTEHYEKVGRVLVQYGTNGTLFYQDRE